MRNRQKTEPAKDKENALMSQPTGMPTPMSNKKKTKKKKKQVQVLLKSAYDLCEVVT